MKTKYMLFAVLTSIFLSWVGNAAADESARVIVKYRENSPLLAKSIASASRRQTLAAIAGTASVGEQALAGRMHLVQAAGQNSEQLAAKLAARSDVEYAVPDRRKTIKAVPNDIHFAAQWYLGTSEASSVNAMGAWDETTGNPIVVAVLDTGIRAEHPDLANKVVRNGSTLAGYDFVSSTVVSNDGDGRDADPSDPGDYVSQADKNAHGSEFSSCDVSDSSWHGTLVAGIVAAETNNGVGVAGTSWGAKILPVRVLGKCYGNDSDIISAIYWAAGIDKTGIPHNPNPAKILNLSFGSSTKCNPAYQDAIDEVVAAGVIVVAAAGNEGTAPGEPADCKGVLAVGGVRHLGTKVGYSGFGASIGISAPAGNCVNESGPCLFPIVTTTNDGLTSPGNSIYTGITNSAVGTSFSAPQVSGVAALMMSAAPTKTASEIVSTMKLGARPFPSSASLQACPTVEPPGSSTSGQCNCVIGQCGAGVLNAAKAVRLVKGLPIALITPPASPLAGVAMTLGSSSSRAGTGSSISTYAWSLVLAGAGINNLAGVTTNAANLQLTATSAGSFTVQLVVTDATGNSDTDTFKVTVEDAAPTARISSATTATAGQSFQLIGNASTATSGRSIVSYAWTLWNGGGIVSSISNANTAVATVVPNAAGTFSVKLTVTDNAGQSSTTEPFSVTVTAAAGASAPTGSGGGGGGGAIDFYALLGAAALLLGAHGTRRARNSKTQ